MRWLCWMMVVGSAWLVAGPAVAQGPGCGCGPQSPYCAPACQAPAYGLTDGCCTASPCCQHVWDTYQQEQERMYAGWGRVENWVKAKAAQCGAGRCCGTPGCTSCATPGCDAGCQGAVQAGDPAPMADPYYSSRRPESSTPLTSAPGRKMGFRAPIRPQF